MISFGRQDFGLFVMNADGSNLRRFETEFIDRAWSPDSSKIALEKPVTVSGSAGSVIAILDIETGTERVLEATSAVEKANGQPRDRPRGVPDRLDPHVAQVRLRGLVVDPRWPRHRGSRAAWDAPDGRRHRDGPGDRAAVDLRLGAKLAASPRPLTERCAFMRFARGSHSGGRFAPAVRLRRPTLYPLSYRRVSRECTNSGSVKASLLLTDAAFDAATWS